MNSMYREALLLAQFEKGYITSEEYKQKKNKNVNFSKNVYPKLYQVALNDLQKLENMNNNYELKYFQTAKKLFIIKNKYENGLITREEYLQEFDENFDFNENTMLSFLANKIVNSALKNINELTNKINESQNEEEKQIYTIMLKLVERTLTDEQLTSDDFKYTNDIKYCVVYTDINEFNNCLDKLNNLNKQEENNEINETNKKVIIEPASDNDITEEPKLIDDYLEPIIKNAKYSVTTKNYLITKINEILNTTDFKKKYNLINELKTYLNDISKNKVVRPPVEEVEENKDTSNTNDENDEYDEIEVKSIEKNTNVKSLKVIKLGALSAIGYFLQSYVVMPNFMQAVGLLWQKLPIARPVLENINKVFGFVSLANFNAQTGIWQNFLGQTINAVLPNQSILFSFINGIISSAAITTSLALIYKYIGKKKIKFNKTNESVKTSIKETKKEEKFNNLVEKEISENKSNEVEFQEKFELDNNSLLDEYKEENNYQDTTDDDSIDIKADEELSAIEKEENDVNVEEEPQKAIAENNHLLEDEYQEENIEFETNDANLENKEENPINTLDNANVVTESNETPLLQEEQIVPEDEQAKFIPFVLEDEIDITNVKQVLSQIQSYYIENNTFSLSIYYKELITHLKRILYNYTLEKSLILTIEEINKCQEILMPLQDDEILDNKHIIEILEQIKNVVKHNEQLDSMTPANDKEIITDESIIKQYEKNSESKLTDFKETKPNVPSINETVDLTLIEKIIQDLEFYNVVNKNDGYQNIIDLLNEAVLAFKENNNKLATDKINNIIDLINNLIKEKRLINLKYCLNDLQEFQKSLTDKKLEIKTETKPQKKVKKETFKVKKDLKNTMNLKQLKEYNKQVDNNEFIIEKINNFFQWEIFNTKDDDLINVYNQLIRELDKVLDCLNNNDNAMTIHYLDKIENMIWQQNLNIDKNIINDIELVKYRLGRRRKR